MFKIKFWRKWSRILHRDIGYFFIGTSIIYGISGIALNHLSDWNPNYSVTLKSFTTNLNLLLLNQTLNNTDVLLQNKRYIILIDK